MADGKAGRAALDQVDRVLAGRPSRDAEALTAAVQGLAAFRDHYVERHRRDGGTRWRATLERVNAVISVVMAAEFPLGAVPWAELENARAWLAGIVEGEADQ